MREEMGSLGNVFEGKMGETAMPKSSTSVKPKITVPDKISKAVLRILALPHKPLSTPKPPIIRKS